MEKEQLKKILLDASNKVYNLLVTAYKKAELEYQAKLQEQQNMIADGRKTQLASEFYQFMATYPMPAQYALDIEANLVLCRWISDNRYELKIPTRCKEKLQPYLLKIHFKEHLFHNLHLFKQALCDQLSYGRQHPFQLIPYMQIVSIYQAEEGHIRIVVELGGC